MSIADLTNMNLIWLYRVITNQYGCEECQMICYNNSDERIIGLNYSPITKRPMKEAFVTCSLSDIPDNTCDTIMDYLMSLVDTDGWCFKSDISHISQRCSDASVHKQSERIIPL